MIDALEAAGAAYMLVGSYSSNFYGIPRATQDADFILQTDVASVPAIIKRLGSRFRLDRQLAFELVTATTRFAVNVEGSSFQIELFLLGDDQHDQERFARRRRVTMLERETFVPSAEDVIVTKLRWCEQAGRDKDVEDVRNVIAVQGDHLQWNYVETWCDRHGTRKLLDEIRRSIPPESAE